MPESDGRQDLVLRGDRRHPDSLARREHADPHLYLGPHAAQVGDVGGTVLRALQPKAKTASVLVGDTEHPMRALSPGLFAAWLPDLEATTPYRLRFTFEDGQTWVRDDPYRFPCSLDEEALYFISEGTHRRLWQSLGSRPETLLERDGFAFAVWAPNARRVSLVGDFCGWDSDVYPMRRLGSSGVWELFVPGVGSGSSYKYEIVTTHGLTLAKADPLAVWAEKPPDTASRTFASDFSWSDGDWMRAVTARRIRHQPVAIYEVHLGSWSGGGETDYRQLAPQLVAHVKALGFNFLELIPIAEHPFDGSWGYQITGYFAPTSRFGDPDDFRFFVDYCHRHGVGVILDWVPAHFVKDAHGLGRFDGTSLYEHHDPRRGEHPDWGTYIFNYGRFEVKNFLVANALYWLDEFHVDGLRVDAVASMLYLDYSREEGGWLPNEHGGRENLEAVALLQEVNHLVHELYPGRFVIAEESTAWPGVTKGTEQGGLGFDLKWNMGWMHDTLKYFAIDPLFRSSSHDMLTFGMMYEYSEAFVNPLSHDEVVHGKGSLLGKMSGDPWRKRANLRTLLTFQFTRPGKVLLFMGSELAPTREWNHQAGLDPGLAEDPGHRGVRELVAELGRLYQAHACLWRLDHQPDGFRWVACHDRERSVISYLRLDGEPSGTAVSAAGSMAEDRPETAADLAARDHLLIILNLTPVPRDSYRLGAPSVDSYRVLLCSDDGVFGGSDYAPARRIEIEEVAADGLETSIRLTLPPLAALILAPSGPRQTRDQAPKKGTKASPKPGV